MKKWVKKLCAACLEEESRKRTTGAAWPNEKLHEIGRKDETVCELCGALDADIRHVLWDCSKIYTQEDIQAHSQLKKDLPVCLQHGIPGMMSKDLDKTFWGLTHDEVTSEAKEILERIGLTADKTKRNMNEAKNFEM